MKIKKNLWSNRFRTKTSNLYKRLGHPFICDKRLYEQDIAASIIAHVQMLVKQKIIKSD